MKVLEITHFSADGKVLYYENEIHNTLHATGEQFILGVLFQGLELPESYYLGLDNRATIDVDDTMTTISTSGEPTANSYERQFADAANFSLITNDSGNAQANSPIVTFQALGGSWGPVRNLFLTNESANDGYLIASVALSEQITVSDGEVVNMRLGMALRDCES